LPAPSVNQRLPSGPVVIASGLDAAVGTAKSLIEPEVVIWPILLPSSSVNQRFLSGPTVIPAGLQPLSPQFGSENSLKVPDGVIWPILSPSFSVNHRFPSGPVTMSCGVQPSPPQLLGSTNSLIAPVGVIWPILLASLSASQRLPSGPTVISPAEAAAVGIENEVKAGEPATGGVSLGAAEAESLGALADPESAGGCDVEDDLEHPASSMVTTARPSTPAVVLWRRSLRVTRSTYGLSIRPNHDSERSKLTHSHAEADCLGSRT